MLHIIETGSCASEGARQRRDGGGYYLLTIGCVSHLQYLRELLGNIMVIAKRMEDMVLAAMPSGCSNLAVSATIVKQRVEALGVGGRQAQKRLAQSRHRWAAAGQSRS